MTLPKGILLLLTAVIFFGCQKKEIEEPISMEASSLTRIRSITTYHQGHEDPQVFLLIYDGESRLTEIQVKGRRIVRFFYTDSMLTELEENHRYIFSYTGGQVSSIERILIVPEDFPYPVNTLNMEYIWESDGSFVRKDKFIDYQADPPLTYDSKHLISDTEQLTEIVTYNETDTLMTARIEVDIIFDEASPNPIPLWNFPVAYNAMPLLPFFLNTYLLTVQEIFFSTDYLPKKISRIRDGTLSVSCTFEYAYTENFLTEIKATIVDHLAKTTTENRSVIEWE